MTMLSEFGVEARRVARRRIMTGCFEHGAGNSIADAGRPGACRRRARPSILAIDPAMNSSALGRLGRVEISSWVAPALP